MTAAQCCRKLGDGEGSDDSLLGWPQGQVLRAPRLAHGGVFDMVNPTLRACLTNAAVAYRGNYTAEAPAGTVSSSRNSRS